MGIPDLIGQIKNYNKYESLKPLGLSFCIDKGDLIYISFKSFMSVLTAGAK